MKISSARAIRPEAQARRDKLKKWVKSTTSVAAATGLGTGTAMVGDALISRTFGAKWAKLPRVKKLAILGPAASLAAMGGAYLTKRTLEEKRKYDE